MQPIALAPGQVDGGDEASPRWRRRWRRRREGGRSRRKAAERPRTMFSTREPPTAPLCVPPPTRRGSSPVRRRPARGASTLARASRWWPSCRRSRTMTDAARAKAAGQGRVPLATDAASSARERQLAARAVRRTRLRKILVRWLAARSTRAAASATGSRPRPSSAPAPSSAARCRSPVRSGSGATRSRCSGCTGHRGAGCGYRIQLSNQFERLREAGVET